MHINMCAVLYICTMQASTTPAPHVPVYVVSCDSARARRMRHRCNALGIQPVFRCFTEIDRLETKHGIVLSKPDKCMLSHIECLKAFYNSGHSHGVVCEDDVHVHVQFPTRIQTVRDFMKREQYDILLLGYLLCYDPACLHERVATLDSHHHAYSYNHDLWGTQMYMLTREHALYVLENFNLDWKFKNPDKPWASDWIITKQGKRAMVHPMLAVEEKTDQYEDKGQQRFHRQCHESQYSAQHYT